MAVLEAGDTPSCSISQTNEKQLKRLGLQNNGVADVFNKGLDALEDIESLEKRVKEFDAGQITLGELLNELRNL